ncbi:hypothetical protein Ocin01_02080 [Orchesella cincta]|uniref:Uncharacterized protein n=1 Tax=Orchesella cincta TaxID=48709 RepID=A0A1D2NH31_ORCCI|nr:hypothetical protein Ocin01_02080 [Orchesella cincta]
MSGDNLFDISDPTSELKSRLNFDSSEDDILSHNQKKEMGDSGRGDTPELITEETPPAEVLELTSDPDLIYNNNTNDRGVEGERTRDEIRTAPTQSSQNLLDSSSHIPACDGEDKRETTTDIILTEDNSRVTTSFLSSCNNEYEVSGTSSAANEPNPPQYTEEISEMPKLSAKLSNTLLETINTSYPQKIDESSRRNGESYTIIKHEPPAVDAPEAEDRKVDASSSPAVSHILQTAQELKFAGATSAYFPDKHEHHDDGDDSVCEQKVAFGKNESSQSSPLNYFYSSGNHQQKKPSQQRPTKPPRSVEVHERKTPVSLKSVNGKPVSPYLCKIFPVVEDEKKKKKESRNSAAKSNKFVVNREQNQMLDENISGFISWQQKLSLLKTLIDKFKENREAEVESPTSDMLAPESKETYMSWLFQEEGGEFNPRKNKLRHTIATQISQTTSFHEKEQMTSEDDDENPLISSPQDRINLVSRGVDLRSLVSSMYKSFKVIQAAIQISDYCFFRHEPELPMKEVLSQPSFQNLIESSNEIEILQNLVTLLSTCKNNVEGYLNSIHEADLVVPENSSLTKISSKLETTTNNVHLLWNKAANTHGEIEDVSSQKGSHVVLACPSTKSQTTTVDMNNMVSSRTSQSQNHRLLPRAHTFVEEQTRVTLSTYFNDARTLIQNVMCDGYRFHINLTSSDPHGPIHGITKAKMEYLGRPTPINLDMILNSIHRCTNYIDTRIACSVVWSRQSKRHLLKYIEKYLENSYRPTTECNRWTLWQMERKLRRANVLASIIRNFSEELADSLTKIHFVILKSLSLLDKLKEPEIPGFVTDLLLLDEVNLNASDGEQTETTSQDEIRREPLSTSTAVDSSTSISYPASVIHFQTLSVQQLYKKLVLGAHAPDQRVSAEALIQILALATKSIESVSQLGEQYISSLGLSKKGKRVMRFVNNTSAQLGLSKEVQLGSLVVAYLSAVDKLNMFEEFICEQKVDIRAKIHKLCMKITRNLYELRGILCIQQSWSHNLAKNTFMRMKEVNEIRRLRKLKRDEKHVNEKIEFLRGSDRSLREAVS